MMNRMMTAVAVLMCTATIATAQGEGQDGRPQDGPPRRMAMSALGEGPLFAGITLTADQKTKLKALQDKRMAAMKQIREASPEERKTMRDKRGKMGPRGLGADAEVLSILTPAQQTQFKKNAEATAAKMKEMRKNGGMRRGGGQGGDGQHRDRAGRPDAPPPGDE